MNQPGAMPAHNQAQNAPQGRGLPLASAPGAVSSELRPAVPDYELLRRVGGGAYGDVWLARSQATGVFRAAKVVWRRSFEDERPYQREFEGIQRFERISREHPSQLALFHIGRNDAQGYFYYVMELADPVEQPTGAEDALSHGQYPGPPLPASADSPYSATPLLQSSIATYVPRTLRAGLAHGRLAAGRVLEIGLALAEALRHLHRHGLVHRDVKPSNVIFVNGRPKLADIGLVTDASDQCSIVGTEGYLPPEGPGTPQADIFALGKVLYEAATGMDRRQFPDLPKDVRSWPDAELFFELNEIILTACFRDSRARYVSAEAMLTDLKRLDQGQSVKRRRARQRRADWAWKGLRPAAVIGLAVAGVVFVRERSGWQRAFPGAPISAVAADAYKAGYSAMRRGTPESFDQALGEFTRARLADPGSVAVRARLFEIYLMGDDHGWFGPVRGRTQKLNELSAELAKLAPADAETHAASAIVLFLNQWKWVEAEHEFKQALQMNPGCRMALTYYGYFLTRLGRAHEARAVLGRAQTLDPTSPLITKFLGHCEFADRRFPEALAFYSRAAQLETNYPSAHYWFGRAYLAMTNYAQALDELMIYARCLGARPLKAEALREALDKEGPSDHWLRYLHLVEADPSTSPSTYAEIYAHLGDRAQALSWLEKAIAQHNAAEFLLFDEFWDNFRGEPKFQSLLERTGLSKAMAAHSSDRKSGN